MSHLDVKGFIIYRSKLEFYIYFQYCCLFYCQFFLFFHFIYFLLQHIYFPMVFTIVICVCFETMVKCVNLVGCVCNVPGVCNSHGWPLQILHIAYILYNERICMGILLLWFYLLIITQVHNY